MHGRKKRGLENFINAIMILMMMMWRGVSSKKVGEIRSISGAGIVKHRSDSVSRVSWEGGGGRSPSTPPRLDMEKVSPLLYLFWCPGFACCRSARRCRPTSKHFSFENGFLGEYWKGHLDSDTWGQDTCEIVELCRVKTIFLYKNCCIVVKGTLVREKWKDCG